MVSFHPCGYHFVFLFRTTFEIALAAFFNADMRITNKHSFEGLQKKGRTCVCLCETANRVAEVSLVGFYRVVFYLMRAQKKGKKI